MFLKMFLTSVLFLCTVCVHSEFTGPRSPCPNIFNYEYNGTKWQGIIMISNVQSIIIKLNVDLSIATILPSVSIYLSISVLFFYISGVDLQKYAGEIRILNPTDKLLHNISHKGFLSYKVLFPVSFPLPVVTLITLNEVKICSGRPGKSV